MNPLNNPPIKHQIKDPQTGKRLRRIFIPGKGAYAWNSVDHHYHRVANYEILRESDVSPLLSKITGKEKQEKSKDG